MRKYLTVSELSNLLNLSPHTIRYYDKAGLINTRCKSDNGYRLYDFEEVYALSRVMLLRESGISIKDIKALINNYAKENYREKLSQSYQGIGIEISRLENLQKEISETIETLDNYDDIVETIKEIEFENRYFILIKESNYEMNYSIKELYDIYVEKGIDMTSLNKQDIVYIMDDENIRLCMETRICSKNTDIFLEAGYYLQYTVEIKDDNEVLDKVDYLIGYAKDNGIELDGDIALIIGAKEEIMQSKSYLGKIQIKIKK